MAKYNVPSKGKDKVVNKEGAEAYSMNPEMELYSLVCTSIMQPKFYETEEEQLDRLRKLIGQCSDEFVGKLAVYARDKMYLRLIPLVLAVELARKKSKLTANVLDKVIQRADEITETLAYYQFANQRTDTKKLNKLSNQLKKGIAKAFHKFSEYQLAKYNRDSVVKLKDAMFLTHPKPKNKEEEILFKKIANDTLEVPYTWEVELSKLGQQKFETEQEKKKAFTQKWEELIDSKKVGYMALLRNLRNILNADVSSKHITKVCDFLSSAESVRKSKQLPFRFFSAYREIESNPSFSNSQVATALEEAVKISIENLKGVEGKVLIACDVSGSMESTISPKSSVERYDIGLLLGQLLSLKTPANKVGIFGDTFKIKHFTSKEPLQNTLRLHEIEGEVGYSTNGYKVIDWLLENNTIVDKIFIFTDCQMWDSYGGGNTFASHWIAYKKIAPNCQLHLFDLAGYGDTPVSIKGNDVYFVAGWSDKVFEMLEAIKQGQSVVQKIKEIEL